MKKTDYIVKKVNFSRSLYEWCIENDSTIYKEWSINNKLSPKDVGFQSNIVYKWRCKFGHEYDCSASNRTQGKSCPYCSNRKVLAGFNDFQTIYPEISQEWDSELNDKKPFEVVYGSTYKAYWKCKQHNHSWQEEVRNRAKGMNCPFCSNHRLLKGFNDLKTAYPNIAKEWDYSKNIFTPSEVLYGSTYKASWICKNGHTWVTTVKKRTDGGQNCPYCSNKKLWIGFNDLETRYPDLSKEWDYSKNKLKPSEVIFGTHKEYHWICSKGHQWKVSCQSRINNKSGCPKCAESLSSSYPEKAIFYYLNKHYGSIINSYKPAWLGKQEIDIFIPCINVGIEYDGDNWHKDIKNDLKKNEIVKKNNVFLIRIREPECPILGDDTKCIKTGIIDSSYKYLNNVIIELIIFLNMKFNQNINIDVDIERDNAEIIGIIGKKMIESSFAIKHPELLKEWDYDLNKGIDPYSFSDGSHFMVFWKCEKGHSWSEKISKRIKRGFGCPVCSNHQLCLGFNDFVTVCPDKAIFWDYEKNSINPHEIFKSDEREVNWKCPKCCGEWKLSTNIMYRRKGCKICGYCKEKKED